MYALPYVVHILLQNRRENMIAEKMVVDLFKLREVSMNRL